MTPPRGQERVASCPCGAVACFGAYLLLSLCALGVARAVVGLRRLAQLLLGLEQLRAQPRHVGAVGVDLRERCGQLLRLRAGLCAERVQRRREVTRRRLHGLGPSRLCCHAVRLEMYLSNDYDSTTRLDDRSCNT